MFVGSAQVISRQDSQSKFQMFTVFSGRHVGGVQGGSIVGSVNLPKTFRRISEVWGNADPKLEEVSSSPICYSITFS